MTLGKLYRDNITGLVGVATARCEYLHLPTQIEIAPPLDFENHYQETVWITEERLSEHELPTDISEGAQG